MTQPSRLVFWRTVLILTAVFLFMAAWQFLSFANELDVVVTSSKSWMGLLVALFIGGLAALLGLASTWFRMRERTLSLLEIPAQVRWLGFFQLSLALTSYMLVFAVPYTRDLLGSLGWVRTLIFWAFALTAMYGLKAIKRDLP